MRYRFSVCLLAALALAQVRADEKPAGFRTGYFGGPLAVSPDGKVLVESDSVYDIPDRRLSSEVPFKPNHVAISPDSKQFAHSYNGGGLIVQDAKTGKVVWDIKKDTWVNAGGRSVAFTPDGRYLVACGGGNCLLTVWNLKTRRPHGVYSLSPYRLRDNRVEHHGVWEALGGDRDPAAKVVFRHHAVPISESDLTFCLSADGKTILAPTGRGTVAVIDVESGRLLRQLHTELSRPNLACVIPSGDLLAVGCMAKDPESYSGIELWDTRTWQRVLTLRGNLGAATRMQFSPDGRLLALGGALDGVRVLDVRTGRLLWWHHQADDGKPFNSGDNTNCSGLAFLPDGSALLTLTDTGPDKNVVQFRNPRTGEILKRDRAEP